MHDENCKIAAKLQEIHDWAHRCLRSIGQQELHEAHRVGHMLLDKLNELPDSNAVKFLAIFEVLGVGADMMQASEELMQQASTETIQ